MQFLSMKTIYFREKTKLIYTIYSRKDEKEIWSNMKMLGVDYVLLERAWCFGYSRSKKKFYSKKKI